MVFVLVYNTATFSVKYQINQLLWKIPIKHCTNPLFRSPDVDAASVDLQRLCLHASVDGAELEEDDVTLAKPGLGRLFIHNEILDFSELSKESPKSILVDKRVVGRE